MMRAVLVFVMWVTATHAADYLSTSGRLSDTDFYRLVACRALPGQDCKMPFVRWTPASASNLTVAITRVDPTFPPANASLIDDALGQAIGEINGLDAGINMRRVTRNPNIKVLLMDHPPNSRLSGTGDPELDGEWLEAAYVHIWWNGRRELTRGTIIITPAIERSSIRSVMLEELVQSLGLLTDVRNPHYRNRSIFAQDSNATVRLQGQDAMAVRRHYTN